MLLKRWGLIGLLGGLMLGTGACTDGYGYSGVNLGWGGGGYDPYWDGGVGGPGWGGPGWGGAGFAGSPYYGWHDNFYYPGTGVFVYDRFRRPHRWSGPQQRFWVDRRRGWAGRNVRPNWGGFGRDRGIVNPGYRADRGVGRPNYRGLGFRGDRRPGFRPDRGPGVRGDRRPDRPAFTQGRGGRRYDGYRGGRSTRSPGPRTQRP